MNWKKSLNNFRKKMQGQIEANIPQKGLSWNSSPQNFLQSQLYEHYVLGHWVDVANFAFMLWDQERERSSNSGKETERKQQ
jgi:hypothetical protein